jgi:UDP-N-acetyl-D-mannosaminuronic acid dehydrogenase
MSNKPFNTVGVVGMGYVGIAEAVIFSSTYNVIGFQRNSETSGWKVKALNDGEYPLDGNEPKISEMLKDRIAAGKLKFTTNPQLLCECDAIIVAVQTPLNSHGYPDTKSLTEAVNTCGKYMKDGTLVVIASTVVPGTTTGTVRNILCTYNKNFLLAHAPERVMPGKLISNIMHEARVIGGIDQTSLEACCNLYFNTYSRYCMYNIIPMSALEAEVCKTAENGIRDIQIAVANELAIYCNRLGINFYNVKKGIDSLKPVETRALLNPGFGVGGHCIPKDGVLLLNGDTYYRDNQDGYKSFFLDSRRVNKMMPFYVWGAASTKMMQCGVDPYKSRVALYGMSYIGGSEDTRNSPSEEFKSWAETKGIVVQAYDPEIGLNEITRDIDVVIIATAHKEFEKLTPESLESIMAPGHRPIIIDGRNIINHKLFKKSGWIVWCIGRGDLK